MVGPRNLNFIIIVFSSWKKFVGVWTFLASILNELINLGKWKRAQLWKNNQIAIVKQDSILSGYWLLETFPVGKQMLTNW